MPAWLWGYVHGARQPAPAMRMLPSWPGWPCRCSCRPLRGMTRMCTPALRTADMSPTRSTCPAPPRRPPCRRCRTAGLRNARTVRHLYQSEPVCQRIAPQRNPRMGCQEAGQPAGPDARSANQQVDWSFTRLLANIGETWERCRSEHIRAESERETSGVETGTQLVLTKWGERG